MSKHFVKSLSQEKECHFYDNECDCCKSKKDKLEDNFNSKNSKSLGLKLVSILSKQLRGNFSVAAKDGKTIFTVAFKDLKQYQSTL